MSSVAVLFPWRPGNPARDRAYAWVAEGWRRCLPEYDQLTSARLPDPSRLDVDGQWCKARHIDALVRATTADVVIVSDVDVWPDPLSVRMSVRTVANGDRLWSVPYLTVYRLSEQASDQVRAGIWPVGRLTAGRGQLVERPYEGHPGGGVVVVPRQTLEDFPFDPRFIGWGHEDDAWSMVMHTIAGKPHRVRNGVLHLWHPPAPNRTRDVGRPESVILGDSYAQARTAARRGDRAPLLSLVDEARALLATRRSSGSPGTREDADPVDDEQRGGAQALRNVAPVD